MTKEEIRKKIAQSGKSQEEKDKLFKELDKIAFPNQSFLNKIGQTAPKPPPKKEDKKEEDKEVKPQVVSQNKKQPVSDGK